MELSQRIRQRLIPCLPFLGVVLASLLCCSTFLTNSHTPGGDGWRIFTYLDYADRVQESYPLWNANANLGESTLSNPDVFFLPGIFLDFFSGNGNLKLNLLLLSAVVLMGMSVYLLGRELGLGRFGAFVAAAVYILSQNNSRMVFTGRLYWIAHTAFGVLSIVWYLNWLRSRRWLFFALAALAWGVAFSYIGYYSLVVLMPLMFGVGLLRNSDGRSLGAAFLPTAAQLFAVWSVGAVMVSFFVFPMVETVVAYASGEPKNILLERLPHPASWLNFFFGLRLDDVQLIRERFVPFLSLVAYPAFFCAVAIRFFRDQRQVRILLALCGAYALVLSGAYYPFRVFPDLLNQLPLLRHIRHGLSFQDGLALCAALLAGTVFSMQRPVQRVGWRRLLWAPVVGGMLLLAGWGVDSFVVSNPGVPVGWDGKPFLQAGSSGTIWRYLAALLVMCSPLVLWGEDARGEGAAKRLPLLGLALLLAQAALYVPGYRGELTQSLQVGNEPGFGPVAERLYEDHSYHRVMIIGRGPKRVGWGGIQTLRGFQYNFSPELRRTLSILLGREVTELRPHWVAFGIDDAVDRRMFELLGIKYVLTNKDMRPDSLGGIGRDLMFGGTRYKNWRLYAYADWEQALRLYDLWKVEPSSEQVYRKLEQGSDEATVFVDQPVPAMEPVGTGESVPAMEEPVVTKESGPAGESALAGESEPGAASGVSGVGSVALRERTAESLRLQVSASRPSIVFVPERYDEGWKASVDGAEVPVLRANGAFRGVFVPAGEHAVRMWYAPWWKYWGGGLSLASIVAVFGLCLWHDCRMRKAGQLRQRQRAGADGGEGGGSVKQRAVNGAAAHGQERHS